MKQHTIHSTSANVDSEIFQKISHLSETLNIKKEKIFKDLIKIIIIRSNREFISGSLTEYQDHSPEKWKKLYYSLDESEIEKFLNARMKLKISISKLAFIAFVLFWDILVKKYNSCLQNKKLLFSINSYGKYFDKFNIYKDKFMKRLEITQKE